jgi:hypothetical protein
MPGAFDGIGLTRRVRQLLPATKITLMSSSAIRDLTGRELPGLGRPNGQPGSRRRRPRQPTSGEAGAPTSARAYSPWGRVRFGSSAA